MKAVDVKAFNSIKDLLIDNNRLEHQQPPSTRSCLIYDDARKVSTEKFTT